MCVKHVPGSSISNKHLDFELYNRAQSVFPGLEALVLNGIGEPLLHPELVQMVKLARTHMPASSWIGFQTNGLLLNTKITQTLLDAGLNRLCISVDSPVDQDQSYSALGHKRNTTLSPISLVNSVRNERGDTNFRLGAEIVLLKETLHQLPMLIEQLAEEGVDFILGSHLLAYHPDAETESLFTSSTAEERDMYLKWKEKARKEGLNLADLTARTWIAPRLNNEHRLQQLYREMLQDGQDNNIWLNVKKLNDWDLEATEIAQSYMDRAEGVAKKYGIELSLPPLAGSTERSCTFIENDSVFIDADGSVMPCHPLWHTQTLYMDEEAKYITQKIFGNIADQDLLTIWQSDEYNDFRKAVLQYDYPFCHSCSLGPCPDITGVSTPFANDCFGIAVPCGHCLWCFDSVRCM